MCVTLHDWVLAEEFPAWAEVKSMLPELRSLWHHRNNLSVDDNGTLWRKRSSQKRSVTVVGSEGWQRTAFPVLSCIAVWRTFGADEDTRTVGRSLLLDGHGG